MINMSKYYQFKEAYNIYYPTFKLLKCIINVDITDIVKQNQVIKIINKYYNYQDLIVIIILKYHK